MSSYEERVRLERLPDHKLRDALREAVCERDEALAQRDALRDALLKVHARSIDCVYEASSLLRAVNEMDEIASEAVSILFVETQGEEESVVPEA